MSDPLMLRKITQLKLAIVSSNVIKVVWNISMQNILKIEEKEKKGEIKCAAVVYKL